MNEAPLVLFTTCVPAAVGLAACSAALGGGVLAAAVALVFASAGMAGSIFHLAMPLRAPTSLRGFGSSPLSQEIASVVAFWVLLLAWFAAEGAVFAEGAGLAVFGPSVVQVLPLVSRVLCVLAALFGLMLLCVINRAYCTPMRPAWNGPEGLGELVGIACGVGGSVYALLDSIARAFFEPASATVTPCFCAIPVDLEVIVACTLPCGLAIACVLCPKQRAVRLTHMAADGDVRITGALAFIDGRRRGLRYTCLLAIAGVVFGLLATALHMLLAASVATLVCWGVAAVFQLAAAIELRMAFYRIPAPARSAYPLRK